MGWRTSKKLRGFSHVHADLSLVLQISREGKFKTVCILFAKLFLRHTNSFPYVLVSMSRNIYYCSQCTFSLGYIYRLGER